MKKIEKSFTTEEILDIIKQCCDRKIISIQDLVSISYNIEQDVFTKFINGEEYILDILPYYEALKNYSY